MSGVERFSLDDSVVVVTAGTGRYGRHLVTDVAAAGATVIATSREKKKAEQIATEEQARGHDVKPARLDLGEQDTINQFCESLETEYESVDGLVNNAVSRPMSHLNGNISTWEQSMAANSTGIFLLTRQIAQQMAATSGGSIVNVSSIQGMCGPDENLYDGTDMYDNGEKSPPPDYFFHKGGLINLSRYFASVFGPDQVRVNTVSPGGIENGDQDPAFVEKYERRTALERFARGEDLTGLVVFLLSDAASYITGTNIPVDGGYTSK